VIDIDGDGSLNMTIHELGTCHRYGIGVKVVVINNQWLGMVRQWQDMIYEGHRSGSDLSDPMAVKAPGDVDIYPDFPAIAAGYRVRLFPAWTDFPAAVADDIEDTRRMNAFIEDRVREIPEQYHWLHKRFKTRPDGMPSVY
jgi:acetolactate synthase-1/2/3 large subunit